MAKKHDIGSLNQLYTDAENADRDVFAEMRSNIQLVAGQHYHKKGSKFWDRVSDAKNISEPTKLRLTQNHLDKCSTIFQNNITSHAPGVRIFPKNEDEPQDQKSAELRQSVWEDIKHRNNHREWVLKRVADFTDIGEVWTKVVFNPMKGRFIGYKQKVVEGIPQVDEAGQPLAGEEPVFEGQIELEEAYGFNVLRAPHAMSHQKSPHLILRKMAPISDLKPLCEGDEKKLKFLEECKDDTFKVFDGNSGGMSETTGQTMLREFYFRPCADYPNGYYYFATATGILAEGELPGGVFPLVGRNYKESQTSPRGRSWIKTARPYQIEINRCASAIATAQTSWGDDKIVTSAGAKMSKGADLPGVRHIQVSGPAPVVIEGRSGDQFIRWMEMSIAGLYNALGLEEDKQDSSNGQIDPMSMLFRSTKYKKKFAKSGETFESFQKEVCEVAMEFARLYYDDNHLIPAIGKREVVNVAEFKNTSPLSSQIKVEPMSEDLESSFGKQFAIQQVLQYMGKDMDKEERGLIVRAMPFLNKEQAMGEFTIDADNATSDILSLDRGQYREPNRYDNHKYLIKRLIRRMKLRDFELLQPEIKQLYERKLMEHQMLEAQLQQEVLAQQAGYIPSGGYEVVCDLYAPDPKDPSKTRRLRIPSEALEWLVKRLEQQGTYTVGLTNMNMGGVADIANLMEKQKTLPPSGSSNVASQPRPGGLSGTRSSNPVGSAPTGGFSGGPAPGASISPSGPSFSGSGSSGGGSPIQ